MNHPTMAEVEAEIARRLLEHDRLTRERQDLLIALRSIAHCGVLTSCTQCKAVARGALERAGDDLNKPEEVK
jgi:hypothetical protein